MLIITWSVVTTSRQRSEFESNLKPMNIHIRFDSIFDSIFDSYPKFRGYSIRYSIGMKFPIRPILAVYIHLVYTFLCRGNVCTYSRTAMDTSLAVKTVYFLHRNVDMGVALNAVSLVIKTTTYLPLGSVNCSDLYTSLKVRTVINRG